MTATERPATLWRIDVHVKTDQGAVGLFIGRNGRDELDRLLAEGRWPVKWPVEMDVGFASLVLDRNGAVSVRGLLTSMDRDRKSDGRDDGAITRGETSLSY
jgi:hypothetical protein